MPPILDFILLLTIITYIKMVIKKLSKKLKGLKFSTESTPTAALKKPERLKKYQEEYEKGIKE